MTNPADDLASLMETLAQPGPHEARAVRGMAAAPVPVYIFSVDEPDPLAIVLVVRTGEDGTARGKIVLPRWQELPAGWDGPHSMQIALPLANDYAHEYGYHAIAIDIESSQMWDPTWGNLVPDRWIE